MPKRGRPSEFNSKKVFAIVQVLRQYPDGVWLRQLAKEASMPVSTVSYYIEKMFDPFVENLGFRRPDGRYVGLRMIRFKADKRTTGVKDIQNYKKIKDSIAGATPV